MSASTGSSANSDRVAGTSVRVFILDDHELVRRGTRDLLAQAGGFDVVGESASAVDAPGQILALRPDVAMLDVQLQDGSGIEVCRYVRTRDESIQAVMVTTFDDEEARLAATLAGAAGFVLKQIRGTQLVDAVRRVAAGETLVDSAARADTIRRGTATMSDPRMQALSGQEMRVLEHVAEGLTNRQIGERLHLSEKTVKNYLTSILNKLGFATRTQAAVFLTRNGSG